MKRRIFSGALFLLVATVVTVGLDSFVNLADSSQGGHSLPPVYNLRFWEPQGQEAGPELTEYWINQLSQGRTESLKQVRLEDFKETRYEATRVTPAPKIDQGDTTINFYPSYLLYLGKKADGSVEFAYLDLTTINEVVRRVYRIRGIRDFDRSIGTITLELEERTDERELLVASVFLGPVIGVLFWGVFLPVIYREFESRRARKLT